MNSSINVSNSCISEKDKYYVIFNMLKFKEYNVYMSQYEYDENVELLIYHIIPQNLYLIL